MNCYGIDLGTSNCLISKIITNLDDSFDVKCLTDDEGMDSFPSVVHFKNERDYIVGETALNRLSTEPDSTIELIKIRLGKTHKIHVKTPSSEFEKSPQEISSYLLSHFNTIHSENIENVVVTVPAFFDQNQKEDLTVISKEYDKLFKKLSLKYEDDKLKFEIKNKLYQKGYSSYEIEKIINEKS